MGTKSNFCSDLTNLLSVAQTTNLKVKKLKT